MSDTYAAKALAQAVGSRARRVGRVLRDDGPRALAQRVTRYAYHRLDAASLEQTLLACDTADSRQLDLAAPRNYRQRGEQLTIGWVTTPPSAGSGGHTTLFRMVEAVERAGHKCELFLYDRYGGDLQSHERVIRQWWPGIKARVRDARNGVSGVDAAVASSWETAHVLARHGREPMRRLYFIQDYEPFFYPRGSTYSLAEDSYRFGFRCIALGQMVGRVLHSELGVAADVTEFGCDTSIYRPLDGRTRTGVVLYARPDTPRRGFWLACLALERFHSINPDVEIHLYGDRPRGLPFPATQHGRLSPRDLNQLYNECVAGLAMSFTNISLVAEEMLAAGTIPVVNDSPYSRADLTNEFVSWAAPTPDGIASALSEAVNRQDRGEVADTAARSVRQFGWSKAQADIVRIVEEEAFGAHGSEPNIVTSSTHRDS